MFDFICCILLSTKRKKKYNIKKLDFYCIRIFDLNNIKFNRLVKPTKYNVVAIVGKGSISRFLNFP